MARIQTYPLDTSLDPNDKWIGTNFTNGLTRNFTVGGIANFYSNTGAISVGGQVSFKFFGTYTGGRPNGSITLAVPSGTNVNFNTLTSIRIHKDNVGGKLVLNFLQTLPNKNIILTNAEDPNVFGVFEFVSITQSITEPNFYDAVLIHKYSNGQLLNEKTYSLSLIQEKADLTGFVTEAPADGQQYVRINNSWQVVNIPVVNDATASVKGILRLTGDLGGTADNPTVPGLAGKANTVHTHVINDVTGLQTALNGKANTIHTHVIADVTNLQTELNNKANTVHTHVINDVTGLQTALNGKIGEAPADSQIYGRINNAWQTVRTALTGVTTAIFEIGQSGTGAVAVLLTPYTDLTFNAGGANRVTIRGGGSPGLNITSGSLFLGGTLRMTSSGELRAGTTSAALPGMAFASDTNTGIFTPTANSDILGFSTNGTERARFTPNGRLLIGTTTDNFTDLVQIAGAVLATSFKVSGGTSSQFLKANGTLDSSVYVTEALANGNLYGRRNNAWEVIDLSTLPTQAQKDAMDNASGPNAGNPFITASQIVGGLPTGEIPSGRAVKTTPTAITSASFVDVPGLSAFVTTASSVNVYAICTFEITVAGGGSDPMIEIQLVVNGEVSRTLHVDFDGGKSNEVGSINYRTAIPVGIGSKNARIQARKISGTKDTFFDNGHLFFMALQAPKGDDGAGVPIGGSVGQILAKASNASYDTIWVDNNSSKLDIVSYSSNADISNINFDRNIVFRLYPDPVDLLYNITLPDVIAAKGFTYKFSLDGQDGYKTVFNINSKNGEIIDLSQPVVSTYSLELPEEFVTLTSDGSRWIVLSE